MKNYNQDKIHYETIQLGAKQGSIVILRVPVLEVDLGHRKSLKEKTKARKNFFNLGPRIPK